MIKPSFTMLVHGEAGVGKSRLAATAQPPVLVIDLEGRARYLPYPNKVVWDVSSENPPELGEWTHCILPTTKYKDLERAFQWLQSGQHCFKSVVVDSLTFAQKRFISDLTGTQSLQEQHWGEVLRVLETCIRDYCDLTQQQSNPVETVVFVVGTKTDNGRRIPLLQGALKDTAAYMYDAVGYLYIAQDQSGANVRNLLVEPQAGIVAKDGTGQLGGPVLVNPNVAELTARLFTTE